jgi:hypothetical protein
MFNGLIVGIYELCSEHGDFMGFHGDILEYHGVT